MSSSSSCKDAVYDLSNPEVGAHDLSGSELCDFGADPDVQFDLVRESGLSSNDEENSASCAMAKVLTLGLIGCYWWLYGMESFNH